MMVANKHLLYVSLFALSATACNISIPEDSDTKNSNTAAASNSEVASSAALLDSEAVLKKYDADGNSKLSKEELKPLVTAVLAYIAEHSQSVLDGLQEAILADQSSTSTESSSASLSDDEAAAEEEAADASDSDAQLTERIAQMVKAFDTDGDEELSADELSSFLNGLVQPPPPFMGQGFGHGPGQGGRPPQGPGFFRPPFMQHKKPDYAKMFTCLDQDGDGNITSAEWQALDAGTAACK